MKMCYVIMSQLKEDIDRVSARIAGGQEVVLIAQGKSLLRFLPHQGQEGRMVDVRSFKADPETYIQEMGDNDRLTIYREDEEGQTPLFDAEPYEYKIMYRM